MRIALPELKVKAGQRFTLPTPLIQIREALQTQSTISDAQVLLEAGRYVEFFTAMSDGTYSMETVLNAVANALTEYHKVKHLALNAYMVDGVCCPHPYDCSMRPWATFPGSPGTVVYEMQGRLYAIGFSLNGTVAVLSGEEREVTALFDLVSPSTQTEAHDLVEAPVFGTLFAEAQMTDLDRQAGVIRGVVMMNYHSTNGRGGEGRDYPDATLRKIAAMSDGLPSYLNHPKDPADAFKPRDVKDLAGRFRNVKFDEGKRRITGDYHIAEHNRDVVLSLHDQFPDMVGASLVTKGFIRMDGKKEIVEDVVAVRSGDLVSDPATTRGLFEHAEHGRTIPSPSGGGDVTMEMTLEAIVEEVTKKTPSKGELLIGVLAGDRIKKLDDRITALTEASEKQGKELGELKVAHTAALTVNTEQKVKLDAYDVADKAREREIRLDKVLSESKLAARKDAITDVFRKALLESSDEAWAPLIDDRVNFLVAVPPGPARPQSAAKQPVPVQEHANGGTPVVEADALEKFRHALTH